MDRSMKIKPTSLPDAFIVESEPVKDDRGLFSRVFCRNALRSILQSKNIVQINHSLTRQKGAIRGMHFQYPPKAETKMVKCLRGSVFEVIIDLRKGSPAFQKWHGEVLAAENMKMMFIPEGFAHGFQTLEENCELLYLHTEFYSPEHEGGVYYDDPKIGIKWPLELTEISDKDKSYAMLSQDFGGIQL
jgi:dTDP-4-dehydrorhamnose 3,5-epimerase